MAAQRKRFYSEAAASYPAPVTRYADELPKTLYQLEFRPPQRREETVIKTFVEDGLKHRDTPQGKAVTAKQIERQLEMGGGVTCGRKSEYMTTINKTLQVPHHRLAAGPPQQTDYVVPLIRGLAEILHSAEPVDIRREAAVSLLHVGLNDGKKHLNAVVEAEPSVIQGMLDILEQNKYDRACVITALDFVNGVLESVPTGRVEVYRRDGIAKIESAQFLHDRAIDNFISWMVSHYFDDFNEAEGDEEAVERLVAEESVLAAQLSDLSKGAQ